MFCSHRISGLMVSSSRFHTTMRSTSQQVRVRLLPGPRALFDQPVHVKVEGLEPHQPVELKSRFTDHKGVIFRASSLYRADAHGQVDVCSSPGLAGSYTGVEPMGLFWSMSPETPHKKLFVKTAASPILVDIDVHSHSGDTGEVLATETIERGFMVEGVRRIPLKEDNIRGVLFLPPGEGQFPGVLDMYTLGGGVCEARASLLANQGFVVLALAYYGYEDLPKSMPKYFTLEYFEEAVTFLRRQPQVQGPGIGIISISKSTEFALSMASYLPGISATVSINGTNAPVIMPLHYKGIVTPALMPVWKNVTVTPSGLLDIRDALPDPMAEDRNWRPMIPVERATGRFLFAVSEDDRNWNSGLFAEQTAARLRGRGKENFEVVRYPNAGHFLEVPFTPHCPSGFHAAVGEVVVFGGEPKAHAEAQLDLWRRVQEFFREHLDSRGTCQKAML